MKNNPFEQIEKENNELLKIIKTFIRKNYGKRCKEIAGGCYCCQMWSIYDTLYTHLANRP